MQDPTATAGIQSIAKQGRTGGTQVNPAKFTEFPCMPPVLPCSTLQLTNVLNLCSNEQLVLSEFYFINRVY